MFKQRLLTALILVPLVLLSIYYANDWTLASVVVALIGLMGWEWLQLIPVSGRKTKILFIGVLLLLIWPATQWLQIWLYIDLISWIFIFGAVLLFPSSQRWWGNRIVVGGLCCLLLPIVAGLLHALYRSPQGQSLIVYLLALIWASDIGAYCTGKQWGTHRLIPAVSPGKTIEGLLGGLGLSILVATLSIWYFKPLNLIAWFGMAICVSLMSMLGDLLISMLKRRCQLKDTGYIFPGHGGVLDRLDSFIAALPLFYFLYGMFF